MINKKREARDLEDIISDLNSLPVTEKLFIDESNNKDKTHEELTKKYFETLNSSVLPF